MPVRSISDSLDKSLRVSRRLPIENQPPPPSRNLQTRGQLSLLTFVSDLDKSINDFELAPLAILASVKAFFLFTPAALANE